MSSFDTETEKLIEAEVAKRTKNRLWIMLLATLLCGCGLVFNIRMSLETRTAFQRTVAAKHALDQKNEQATERLERLEKQTEELTQMSDQLTVMTKKVEDRNKEIDAMSQELGQLISAKNIDYKRSLAIVQQTRADCDKKKSDAESLNAQAKANHQEASELIERCVEAADKKFAECKKICESANVPPFWPQRLSPQTHPSPFLESRAEGIFLFSQ